MASKIVDVSEIVEKLQNLVRSTTRKSMAVVGYSNALAMLLAAPELDAVVPVRCQKCKLWGPRLEDSKTGLCWLDASEDVKVRREDEYCSRGVIRQEGDPEPASPVNT